MELTAKISLKQSPLLKPALYCIAQLALHRLIKPKTASRWATNAANRAFKYRVNKGQWQRLELDLEIDVTVGRVNE